jgi:hypothetical protein
MGLLQKQIELATCGQWSVVQGSDRGRGFCGVRRRLDKRVVHLEATRLLDRC